ncbi:uncharacterized protein B0H18DRAFT_1124095 [Fomitopsis serialis]|uniref:uncharacterized protein n=1 Tax=Fomitopsis serialis TaxID=139415 RepID=UPI0020074605|nr:uncharacterized protein B0H18DRAFT_1124095 [Neoantrodia serialis]KAH9916681.1 hypothetical protein B0H18DRAFT_1124095 [Neoantrodia serialis]
MLLCSARLVLSCTPATRGHATHLAEPWARKLADGFHACTQSTCPTLNDADEPSSRIPGDATLVAADVGYGETHDPPSSQAQYSSPSALGVAVRRPSNGPRWSSVVDNVSTVHTYLPRSSPPG